MRVNARHRPPLRFYGIEIAGPVRYFSQFWGIPAPLSPRQRAPTLPAAFGVGGVKWGENRAPNVKDMGENGEKEGARGPQQGEGGGGLIFNVRRASGDDAAFVFAYWLQDYFERSKFAKGISKTLFMRFHHLVLERVIARSVVFVACDPEAPAVAYGFACGELAGAGSSPPLHYVYVKRRFRRLGVGCALAQALGILPDRSFTFTHLTDDGVALRKKYLLAEYNPYAV